MACAWCSAAADDAWNSIGSRPLRDAVNQYDVREKPSETLRCHDDRDPGPAPFPRHWPAARHRGAELRLAHRLRNDGKDERNNVLLSRKWHENESTERHDGDDIFFYSVDYIILLALNIIHLLMSHCSIGSGATFSVAIDCIFLLFCIDYFYGIIRLNNGS